MRMTKTVIYFVLLLSLDKISVFKMHLIIALVFLKMYVLFYTSEFPNEVPGPES